MFCVIFAWNGFVAAWKLKLLYQTYLCLCKLQNKNFSVVCCTTLWWDGAGKGRGWKTAAIIYCWQQQHVCGRTAQLSDISSGATCVADLDSRALALTKEASGNSRALCPCRLKNQIAEHVLQTCPRYNMLKKTLASGDLPADMSQIQHAEEDTGQWRPPSRHVPDKHAEEDTGQWRPPSRHVPATTCWRRHWPVETSLQTCPMYLLRKIHWPVQTPHESRPSYNMLRRLTGQCRPPMSHVPATTCWEDSLASADPPWVTSQLQHAEKTHWPVKTPPCRPSSTTLGRNWRGQLNSPSRQVCPCAQQMTKSKTLTKLTSK